MRFWGLFPFQCGPGFVAETVINLCNSLIINHTNYTAKTMMMNLVEFVLRSAINVSPSAVKTKSWRQLSEMELPFWHPLRGKSITYLSNFFGKFCTNCLKKIKRHSQSSFIGHLNL